MTASQFCAAWKELGTTYLSMWKTSNRGSDPEGKEMSRRLAEDWTKLAEVAPQEIRAEVGENAQEWRQFTEGTIDVKTYVELTSGSRARLLSWSQAHCPRPSIPPLPSSRPGPSN
jgi:hypothetical protein